VYASAEDQGSVRGYLAGTDQTRADDLRSALLDDAIAGILFACGGYGAQRTLEAMRWDGLELARPKVLAGYSDVTAVLEAVAVRLGWASMHGPMVAGDDFAEAYSFSSLMRCLLTPEHAMEFDYRSARTVTGGTAKGITVGGNLSLLTTSLATGTSRTARGGILLLEDV